ncbi:putative threonine synthase [Kockovaella imperatae]|uniref:threonine synthase n=1 Tax=Kockovaella imperatae TaxID=4999 RepID=A0A1Y1UQF7_9TREE|nr:putative threonine synthase [Kockovaella imperatae]ORX39686.1 putative threonine synthase [Kockovaella imperatae]
MSDSNIRYFSTRGGGGEETLGFEEVVFGGLAPDGGLYVPTSLPTFPNDWQTTWADYDFKQLAFEVMSRFIPSSCIPHADLQSLIDSSYSTFKTPLVTPLRQVGDSTWVLELFHGPTLAFKDVALQFLGNLFSYFLSRRNKDAPTPEHLTVLGATSGDTGSAAIYGLRGKPHISCFILYPEGRVSPIQQAQMTTVEDKNIFCVSVANSDFDACQTVVKTLFSDNDFNNKHRLGAVNSINFARILAQITYYVSAVLQLPKEKRDNVKFVVPSGNFGDALAGWYASKLMRLPSVKMVIATNENDTVAQALKTGRYGRGGLDLSEQANETAVVNGSSDGKQSSKVKATHSPAMDILLSSNFERLLFYLAQETGDGSRAGAQATLRGWMDELKRNGTVDLGNAVKEAASKDFVAEAVSDDETLEEIRQYYKLEKYGPYVVDPHTAVGLYGLRSQQKTDHSGAWVSLSTAHPAKFSSAVEKALDKATFSDFDFRRDVMPEEFKKMETMKQRIHRVDGEDGVRQLIEKVQRGDDNESHEHPASL